MTIPPFDPSAYVVDEVTELTPELARAVLHHWAPEPAVVDDAGDEVGQDERRAAFVPF